jgi:hypothetical protein
MDNCLERHAQHNLSAAREGRQIGRIPKRYQYVVVKWAFASSQEDTAMRTAGEEKEELGTDPWN